MKVQSFEIPGLLLLEPRRFGDARGWFAEVWQQERYSEAGIGESFVQDNLARSAKGALRGLHAQEPHAQGKLVQVFDGSVFDVAVDLRSGSPTFGQWEGVVLNADQGTQFYVPPGFFHGYYVLSDTALFGYKTTDIYSPQDELAVRWNDPDLAIDWPLDGDPTLSDKDRNAPLLRDIPREKLTTFAA
jgi:dTDP-4-dehydrorhamnose 3,5-epimerase